MLGLRHCLHVIALILMAATETGLLGKLAFLLVWAMLNCFVACRSLRRPSVAALLSLEIVVALTLLSRFKYDKLWMTVDFVDLMIIDRDTSAFLLAAFPASARMDLACREWPRRSRSDRRLAAGPLPRRPGCQSRRFAISVHGALVGSVAVVPDRSRMRISSARSYVSKFARTGVEAIHEFAVTRISGSRR